MARLRQLNPTLRVSSLKDALDPYQHPEDLARPGCPNDLCECGGTFKQTGFALFVKAIWSLRYQRVDMARRVEVLA
jgi:hypothetical protein